MNPKVSAKEKLKILISSVACCLLAFLLMIVFIPKLIGYETYYIQTGSMGAVIPKGSLVFAKEITFDEVKLGDILTFHNDDETEHFTHRVIEIDKNNQMFTTKGDANKDADPSPTSFYFCEGRVDFSIPLVGYVAEFLNSVIGKVVVVAAYLAWIAVEIEIFIIKRKSSREEETV
ncbi:MAG: signal peptidase I [Clostridia bacterium]|nr:signal peptidase I [Clostridia bacterium]